MAILTACRYGFLDMWLALKGYDMDAFWKDKQIRFALITWSVFWIAMDVLMTSNVMNFARSTINYQPGMTLGIISWIFAACVLFWFIAICGMYLLYPLIKQDD